MIMHHRYVRRKEHSGRSKKCGRKEIGEVKQSKREKTNKKENVGADVQLSR